VASYGFSNFNYYDETATLVTPTKVGVQLSALRAGSWIPACAGMTMNEGGRRPAHLLSLVHRNPIPMKIFLDSVTLFV
jgi:hypothetical protein